MYLLYFYFCGNLLDYLFLDEFIDLGYYLDGFLFLFSSREV
jgi:hypothetical protein